MGNSLNIKTIAEGVETKEQMDLVESLGCDEIQGYYFAKPMDIEGLRKFILENKVQE
jgi:EAL domain-containing protein (putative c-di-GMP-specific phosphodiesterase class I)